mmetsp:Transcript_11802/g.18021  ORF Transcript_11802/g.18021 Transcript_11802/m.18021 type:complete len:165 (+) Transcript_11802:353-847(+)
MPPWRQKCSEKMVTRKKINELACSMMQKFLDSWIEWTQTMNHLGNLHSTERSGTQKNSGSKRRGSPAMKMWIRSLSLLAPKKRKGGGWSDKKGDRSFLQKIFFSKQKSALHKSCRQLMVETDTEDSSLGGSNTVDKEDVEETVCLAVHEHAIEAYLSSVLHVSR